MKYHELTSRKHKPAKRVGRGIAAGLGKTAGRGTKGQKARAGWSRRPGFAGGQNPLMQQLPKLPGFNSFRNKAAVVFTDQINNLKEVNVTAEVLSTHGLIEHPFQMIKLLKRGELKSKHQVSLPGASESAIAQVEAAGGSFTKVDRMARVAKKTTEPAPTNTKK